MSQPIEPKFHSSGSRFTASLGEGASRGFRYGVLGAAIGLLAVPAAAAGLAFAAGVTSVAALATIGVVSALVLSPVTIVATGAGSILGGLLGINNGAKDASARVGKEHEAARYTTAYAQTKPQIQNAMMAQMLQPEPAMAAANDNPFHQASPKIDAATAAHQNRVVEPRIEQVRG
jgi:hypothetical protein